MTRESVSRSIVALCALCLALTACGHRPQGGAVVATNKSLRRPIPISSVRGTRGRIALTLIFLDPTAQSHETEIMSIAAQPTYAFTPLASSGGEGDAPTISLDSFHRRGPIVGDAVLARRGHGFSDDDRQRTVAARSAVTLSFEYSAIFSASALVIVERLVLDLAERFNAVIIDDDTGDAFTPASWRELRVDTLSFPVARVGNEVAFVLSGKDRSSRLYTRGMSRFAMPDLVAEDVPRGLEDPVFLGMRMILDSMAHNPSNVDKGIIVVELPPFDRASASTPLPVNLHVVVAPRKQHDPANWMMGIDFYSEAGTTQEARVLAFMAQMHIRRPPSETTNHRPTE